MEGAGQHKKGSPLKGLKDFLEQSGIFVPVIRQNQQPMQQHLFSYFSASFLLPIKAFFLTYVSNAACH